MKINYSGSELHLESVGDLGKMRRCMHLGMPGIINEHDRFAQLQLKQEVIMSENLDN